MTATPDDELSKLLDQFVRVRIVQMGGVDLSLFQFDPFLSWSVFFLNADKTIYGRFGSASPNTKRNKKDSNPNHTVAGLKDALAHAVGFHRAYTRDPKTWGPKLARKTGPTPPWKTIESTPAARKYKRLGRIKGVDQKGCAHCHEIQRAVVDSYLLTKKRIPDNQLWLYPQPEVLGVKLSRHSAAHVTEVAKGSFAARAGVKVGDRIVEVNGQPILSVADVQFALHTFPDAGGELPVQVRRKGSDGGAVLVDGPRVVLKLPKDWRIAEDFGWRYRVAGYAMWLWAGVTFADHPKGVRVANPSPWWFKKPNKQARERFRKGDVIVEVDGRKGWSRSTLLAYLMRDKKLGSSVKLKVLRGGATVDVAFRIPRKQPEVLGH